MCVLLENHFRTFKSYRVRAKLVLWRADGVNVIRYGLRLEIFRCHLDVFVRLRVLLVTATLLKCSMLLRPALDGFGFVFSYLG